MPSLLVLLLQLLLLPLAAATENEENSEKGQLHLATWKIEEFTNYLAVLLTLLATCIFKMFYPRIPYIPDYVPQSLVLLLNGVIFGAARKALQYPLRDSIWELTPDLFFKYLLPPIVLDAAYQIYNRTFIHLTARIMIFAVVGTLINFLIIGPLMFGLHRVGAMGSGSADIPLNAYLLFASIIVAVDPVAVLAIFQEIGVSHDIYYSVFGESLFNDGVTVVLYEIMQVFVSVTSVTAADVGLGFACFMTISFGGFGIGVVFGVFSCLLTRWHSHFETAYLLVMAYFSYILTDCVGWSGIIAMIGCGFVQAAYAFHNISTESLTTLEGIVKQMAEVNESVIFFYIGIQLFSTDLEWSTGFCLWGFVTCTLSRAVSVLVLAQIVNYLRINNMRISLREQGILIYGGLRGAVAFSLAFLMDMSSLGVSGERIKRIMVTGTIFMILVTVGLQGLTMKPLTRLFHIRLARRKELSLFSDLTQQALDHTLAGVEAILGAMGRNTFRETFSRLDDRFVRKILQRNPECHDCQVIKTYEEIALNLHLATVKPKSSFHYLENLPDALVKKYILDESLVEGSSGRTSMDSGGGVEMFRAILDVPPSKADRFRRCSSLPAGHKETLPQWLRPPNRVPDATAYPSRNFERNFKEVMRRKSIRIKQDLRNKTRSRSPQRETDTAVDQGPTNS